MRSLFTNLIFVLCFTTYSASSYACNLLCERIPEPDELTTYMESAPAARLSVDSIKVLVWNLYKQRKKKFWEEYPKLAEGNDLTIIQENALNSEFLESLTGTFSLAHASSFFMKEDVRAGASNISKAAATRVYGYLTEDVEPWVKTPKAIVGSTYRLENSNQELLVLNIHGINFRGNEGLQRQLEGVEILKTHKGPVIFAGDFNTKNDDRHELTEKYLAQYGLQKVDIKMSKKKVLDLAFVRGIEVISAEEVLSKGSDHPALVLELKIP